MGLVANFETSHDALHLYEDCQETDWEMLNSLKFCLGLRQLLQVIVLDIYFFCLVATAVVMATNMWI